jgi:hypothetical protein
VRIPTAGLCGEREAGRGTWARLLGAKEGELGARFHVGRQGEAHDPRAGALSG